MNRVDRDRLRALLRAADPAAGVEGPPTEESLRLRRTVVAAVPERPRSFAWRAWLDDAAPRGARRWALAAVATALLLTGGPAVLRWLERAPASPPERVAARPAVPRPPELPDASPAPPLDRATAVASSTSTPDAPIARPSATPSEEPSNAAPRLPLLAAAPAGREAVPDAILPTAPSGDRDAADPGVALAALPAPLGRQIQVTAPGGTRIVWILTPSTGP
jgi:hypothetical protein